VPGAVLVHRTAGLAGGSARAAGSSYRGAATTDAYLTWSRQPGPSPELGYQDSNLDHGNQNPASCRYSIPDCAGGERSRTRPVSASRFSPVLGEAGTAVLLIECQVLRPCAFRGSAAGP